MMAFFLLSLLFVPVNAVRGLYMHFTALPVWGRVLVGAGVVAAVVLVIALVRKIRRP